MNSSINVLPNYFVEIKYGSATNDEKTPTHVGSSGKFSLDHKKADLLSASRHWWKDLENCFKHEPFTFGWVFTKLFRVYVYNATNFNFGFEMSKSAFVWKTNSAIYIKNKLELLKGQKGQE